jgi:hypothetical protein
MQHHRVKALVKEAVLPICSEVPLQVLRQLNTFFDLASLET